MHNRYGSTREDSLNTKQSASSPGPVSDVSIPRKAPAIKNEADFDDDDELNTDSNFIDLCDSTDGVEEVGANDSVEKSRGWYQDRKAIVSEHSSSENASCRGGSEGDEEEAKDSATPMWACAKCYYDMNTNRFRCGKCRSWKDGRMPTKKNTKVQVTQGGKKLSIPAHYKSSTSKSELKPLYQVGEEVYAFYPETEDWYPGIVLAYRNVTEYGDYGPDREYKVRFEDGDISDYLEQSEVRSREDYMLFSLDKEWIGVEHHKDPKSNDSWAREVGWYEVSIGELVCVSLYKHNVRLFLAILVLHRWTNTRVLQAVRCIGGIRYPCGPDQRKKWPKDQIK